jgi:hypothetical protein
MMVRFVRSLAFLVSLLSVQIGFSLDDSYTLEIEMRKFTSNPEFPSTYDSSYSFGFEPELKHSFGDGSLIFTVTPFGRWDSQDEARDHADFREFNFLYYSGEWEALFGFSKVFWGVAESSHLVDIVNQTDHLEGIDGEDKLGQPMIRLSRSFSQSTISTFILPGFREREFLSQSNPLSLPFSVKSDPLYESDNGDDQIDYALRYSGYSGIVDYGVSWFHGTSRDPEYQPGADGELIAFYSQIDQLGVDAQMTSDAWLWKLETIRRIFNDETVAGNEDFTAAVGGIEYSIYGMREGLFDLGILAEYHYDSRGDPSTVVFQNDLFTGLRFAFTDAESSEVLAGVFVDLDDQTSSFRLEGNRRVFTDFRLSVEAQAFSNVDEQNVSYHLRNSDFVLVSLEMFF